jgi:hypothetical protein
MEMKIMQSVMPFICKSSFGRVGQKRPVYSSQNTAVCKETQVFLASY